MVVLNYALHREQYHALEKLHSKNLSAIAKIGKE
jgi:hypothetical protein